jgi:hypothetical protein
MLVHLLELRRRIVLTNIRKVFGFCTVFRLIVLAKIGKLCDNH